MYPCGKQAQLYKSIVRNAKAVSMRGLDIASFIRANRSSGTSSENS
jgi:hypothetical protein